MALHIWNVTEATPPEHNLRELANLAKVESKEQKPKTQRWFLELSYKGEGFCGWQRQPNSPSVQQTLEEALSTILRREVPVVGAGRTDTGVNARVMWVHFDASAGEFVPEVLLKGLNQLCGPNIAMKQMRRVRGDAHARFDAQSRTYRYIVVFDKNPFLKGLAWRSFSKLNLEEMNRACECLLETEDFTSFAKLHSDAKTNICKVSHAHWDNLKDDPELRWPEEGAVFTITADRFLRNMVRAIVGTLADVGRGNLSVDGFVDIIGKKNRCAAGQSMPPYALYLWDIKYPDGIWQDNEVFYSK